MLEIYEMSSRMKLIAYQINRMLALLKHIVVRWRLFGRASSVVARREAALEARISGKMVLRGRPAGHLMLLLTASRARRLVEARACLPVTCWYGVYRALAFALA